MGWPETRSWLDNLKNPVHVVVTIPEDTEDTELAAALLDIRGLLREFDLDKYVVQPSRRTLTKEHAA